MSKIGGPVSGGPVRGAVARVLICAVLLAVPLFASCGNPGPNEAASAVEGFIRAFKEGNLQEAARYAPFLSELDEGTAAKLTEQMSRLEAWEILEVRARRRNARVRARLEYADGATQILFPLTVKGGSWIIENKITSTATIEHIPAEPPGE